MSEALNLLLMIATALVYFAVLSALFRARGRLGIGAFFCALGVMHFLETYLASTLYVALPFGLAVLEEGAQALSSVRSAGLDDLAADLAGMVVFWWMATRLRDEG